MPTNPVGTWVDPAFGSQTGTVLKTNYDNAHAVAKRFADAFAAHEASPADMTVVIDAGFLWNQPALTLTEVAQATTALIAAPAVNPRIDRVVIRRSDGVALIVAGVENVAPVPPAIPAGAVPCCQISLQTSTVAIVNALITDERPTAGVIDDFSIDSLAEAADLAVADRLVIHDDSAGALRKLAPVTLRDFIPAAFKNALINGGMRVAQRRKDFTSVLQAGAFINSDGKYTLDRWLLLSDGNDRCDVTRENTVIPAGGRAAIRLDTETVSAAPNSEKFGIAQIIEAQNGFHLIGGTVSLSFKARTTAGAVRNLRAHILSWSGTEDTFGPTTRDMVSSWGAEGTNPTLVANWTAENVAADLALTNAYQTFKIENIAIDTAGAKNIAVLIHVDDRDLVAGDLVYIADVQLEAGVSASPFEVLPIEVEVTRCQRYFEKSVDIEQDVGTATNNGSAMSKLGAGNGTQAYHSVQFQTAKRVGTPFVTARWQATNGTDLQVTVNDITTEAIATGTPVSNIGTHGLAGKFTTTTSGPFVEWHWYVDAEL